MNLFNTVIMKYEGNWLRFTKPIEVLRAFCLADVESVIDKAYRRSKEGKWAVGFVCYEAAAAFDNSLKTLPATQSPLPLVWFAVYCDCEKMPTPPKPSNGNFDLETLNWQPDTTKLQYNASIAKIKSHIKEGNSYQVNYTIKLKSPFDADAYGLFFSVANGSGAEYCCFIDTADFAVCSFSPELFFSMENKSILTRPVKGTIARGLTADQDLIASRKLRSSKKDMAENVMIVDMLRNDLGKIATTGSVEVQKLFEVEKYPTLYQLSSTITAKTEAEPAEVFKHLFPCASITGAPKCRTMKIISELETSQRGIYTGSIGCFAPQQRASFNVAIRTAVIDKSKRQAVYGVGGGIVWDSTAKSEYDECIAKAAVLRSKSCCFELIESLLWNKNVGFHLLELHLKRLAASADYFDFAFCKSAVLNSLNEAAQNCGSGDYKIRLLLGRKGSVQAQAAPLKKETLPLKIRLSEKPIEPRDIFLYHKTTRRQVYERALSETANCDEVLLYNTENEITECTYNNILFEKNGTLYTPPIKCGLLAGVGRESLLKKGLAAEKTIKIEHIADYDKIFVINSVRGIREAVF